MIDLSKLSVAELRGLHSQITEQINTREKDEIAKVQQQIVALAQSVGMTVEQVMGFKGTKDKKPVAVRYQHPDDSSKQWTGRGHQPKWVKEFVEGGRSLEELLVP
ncbi:H-NS family nucleoid-associated regulatory protein [Massilia sp. LC238]|jgi:DNA-binding protein H-NS|uniref:H-NS histone family protein n=1 Tax=Massilia sp. LC238 TaxID=1502852 RepID=UPI0004E360A3|nr:H-NS histone family protein [Massilia sp. LC238]KFC72700.1 H-NS histone family protein [Massilia sp. LC238]